MLETGDIFLVFIVLIKQKCLISDFRGKPAIKGSVFFSFLETSALTAYEYFKCQLRLDVHTFRIEIAGPLLMAYVTNDVSRPNSSISIVNDKDFKKYLL